MRRSARPQGGPPGAALPHQRLSAFCSPHFFREWKMDEGHPPPPKPGGGALAKAGSKGVCLKLAWARIPHKEHDNGFQTELPASALGARPFGEIASGGEAREAARTLRKTQSRA